MRLTWNSGMVERMSMQIEARRNNEETMTRICVEIAFVFEMYSIYQLLPPWMNEGSRSSSRFVA